MQRISYRTIATICLFTGILGLLSAATTSGTWFPVLLSIVYLWAGVQLRKRDPNARRCVVGLGWLEMIVGASYFVFAVAVAVTDTPADAAALAACLTFGGLSLVLGIMKVRVLGSAETRSQFLRVCPSSSSKM